MFQSVKKVIYLVRTGFPKFFFQMAPFKETKKAMAPFNKTTQKLPLKTPKNFFSCPISNSKISSVSFKTTIENT